ncbi:hypothetical protein PG987_002648 [Apiospora arundinis]
MSWSPPSPLPKYVYKIIPTAPPSPIPETYPPSDLDKQDGFIHLSNAEQVFASLWVLKLRFSPQFSENTRWEGPMDGCAHLYGEFGAADVEDAREFTRTKEGGDGSESWATTMAKGEGESTWLE